MEVKNGIPWIRAIGSEGWIESKGWDKPLTASTETLLDLPDNPIAVPHNNREHWDFLMAIKEGRKTVMHPELGQRPNRRSRRRLPRDLRGHRCPRVLRRQAVLEPEDGARRR